jgi:hypothetical protein
VSSTSSPRRRALPSGPLARDVPAWAIAALLAVVYLILAPQSPDLAAASYRSELFSRVGFTLWDNSWYGGHHLPAYSVLAPALGALVGPRLLTALSTVAAVVLFGRAIDGRFPARACAIATPWFALGASIALLSSRVPFDLGLAIGLGAIVLAQRRRMVWALALTVLCSLASPVAGAFLALAMLAWALTSEHRGWPLALSVAALAPIALLSLAFPEGGDQPFVASAFFPALAAVLVIGAAMPPQRRALRAGVALYAVAMIGSYLVPSAVGGNADRLGALATGPLAACALLCTGTRWHTRLLVVAAPALLYWQARAPVVDYVSTLSNAGVQASYYRPLVHELGALDVGYGRRPARIEVVPTADHWEARFVAPSVMIARGWERQLDGYRNGLFYSHSRQLTAARYRQWLSEQAISYVALPDAKLDYSGKAEARLVGSSAVSGPGGYLHEVWRNAHWRLYAVLAPTPLASAPSALKSVGSESFALYVPAPGSYTVRLHFSPYWSLRGVPGCVARAPGDWTAVRTRSAGTARVGIDFSLARVFAHGARCN